MGHVLIIIDWFLYILFTINVLYLLVHSLASCKFSLPKTDKATKHKRFAILIPAYKEDAVIHECVHSCLQQDYPVDHFETIVISDRMQPETNASLAALPIRLVEVHFEKSTKSKSLNVGMAAIGDDFDIALVLDADNVIPSDYLSDINDLFANPDVEAVQTHRIAKNMNNDMALLDAVSEEINNTIFRLGHAKLGLSAALIGSGMAFRYDLFRDTMLNIKAVGGFDRELELTLLYQGKRFYYLPDTFVFDEKIQNTKDFSRQRRRWLSAQWHYCRTFVKYLGKALAAHNWDFCDKMFVSTSFNTASAPVGLYVFSCCALHMLLLDVGAEVVGAFCLTCRGFADSCPEALLYQAPCRSVVVPAIYVLADGSQYLQTTRS